MSWSENGLRITRRHGLIGGAAWLLAGCGFELRKAPEFHFDTIVLNGFPKGSSTLAALKRSIESNGKTRVVEAVSQAQVVFEALNDGRESIVSGTTAAGQVRDITLIARLKFSASTPAGKVLIAPAEIALSRDMTYDESEALGKEQESSTLFRAMQEDLAQQVVRRLAAIKLS